ncbi:Plant-drug/metabolite exporter [Parasponia andersonii]|uniref:WAT1-related protein n=1 Tax=Parasponia andersonii TaxID=3476 RepID=A0A2P5A563_PARAD|nr:Plant-drug/metabolite exporter [Parasponia andersonii]
MMMMMMKWGMKPKLWECVAFAGMVTMESCTIVLTIWAKTVLTNGMSPFVFVVYTHALSSLILLPFSFFFHRRHHRSTEESVCSLNLFMRLFLLGLTGITIPQNLAFTGLSYSSPIVVCAMGLMLPALSFILSVILRKTKVDWRSSSFQAKVGGTLISFMGATMVEFYKGPLIRNSSSLHLSLLAGAKKFLIFSSTPEYWVLGGILLAAANLSVSVWNILQMGSVKQYPQVMKVASFYSTIGTIQSALLCLFLERDLNAWKLNPNSSELVLVVLTAIFMGIIRSSIHVWCMRIKGPFYVPMFKPFGLVFATIFGISLPASTLRCGSVIGTAIVGMGYYTLMWGQLNEDEVRMKLHDIETPQPSDEENMKTPLLREETNV